MKRYLVLALLLMGGIAMAGDGLLADRAHDVVVAAGVAVRYTRQAQGPVRVFVPPDPQKAFPTRIAPKVAFWIYEDQSAIDTVTPPEKIAVEVFAGVHAADEVWDPETQEAMGGGRGMALRGLTLTAASEREVRQASSYMSAPDKAKRSFYVDACIWSTPHDTYLVARKSGERNEARIAIEISTTDLQASHASVNLGDPSNGYFRW